MRLMMSAMPAVKPAASLNFGLRRVLWADDDRDTLEILQMLWPHIQQTFPEDLKLDTARSPDEAWEKLLKTRYDVFVTDNDMPARDQGLKLLERLNELDNPPEVRALHTGRDFASNSQPMSTEARKRGAQFFPKGDMLATILTLLNTLKTLP